MDKLEVTTVQDIEIEPEQMAKLFWSMGSDEQIKFFNHLAVIAPRCDFEMQLLAVVNPEAACTNLGGNLTHGAFRLFQTIRDLVDNK